MFLSGKRYNLIILVLTGMGLFIAFWPTYWSFSCHFWGKYCESSFLYRQTLDKNFSQVIAKINTEIGRAAFQGLYTRNKSYWLSEDQIELVAEFIDGEAIVIDSFAKKDGNITVYNNHREHIIALVHSPQKDRQKLTLFFPFENLVRRTIKLECDATKKSPLQVHNLHYVHDERKLMFDIESKCFSIKINSNKNFDISDSIRPYKFTNDSEVYGTIAIIQFDKNLFVDVAYDKRRYVAHKQRKNYESDCFKKIRQEKSKLNGELWSCFLGQGSNLSHVSANVNFYSWGDKKINLVHEAECYGPSVYKDKSRKVIISVCNNQTHPFIGSNRLQFELIKQKQTHLYTIYGDCTHFFMSEIKMGEKEKSIEFVLDTDCTEISVDNKKVFQTGFKKQNGSLKIDKKYKFYLNEKYEIVGLHPAS